MGKKAKFLACEDDIEVTLETAPEFYALYRDSILLALKIQGALTEAQYDRCERTAESLKMRGKNATGEKM